MQDKLWVYFGTAAFIAVVAGLATRTGSPPMGVAVATFLAGAVTYLIFVAFEFTPEEGVPVQQPQSQIAGLAPGLGRALIEQLPTALVLIERGGKIAYANIPARNMLPRLVPGGHFASLIRAPGFVETVSETLLDGKEREVAFSLTGSRQHFEARIARLPQEMDPAGTGQVIVQIEDRTKATLSEEMRRDFIANASHELRTPLASILGYIETLQGHAKNDPKAQTQFLGIMETQASRMQRLVDDLILTLARDTMDAMKPTAQKAGVELVDALPDEDIVLPGDRDEILQVLHNLIDNAIKYSGRGSSVTVSLADPALEFPDLCGISISDTGPGIAPEHLLRLTERFFRVSVLQSRNKGGTGLGLAIVKHIINRHGGELQIESDLGEGSCFTVWMPLEIRSYDSEMKNIEVITAA